MKVPQLDQRTNRVVRGGGWISNPEVARVTPRYGFSSGDRYNFIGFRLVVDGKDSHYAIHDRIIGVFGSSRGRLAYQAYRQAQGD